MVNLNSYVGFGGHFLYKQIVVATHNMHVRCKTFYVKEQLFLVTKVTPNAHIRFATQGLCKVVHPNKERVVADNLIQKTFATLVLDFSRRRGANMYRP